MTYTSFKGGALIWAGAIAGSVAVHAALTAPFVAQPPAPAEAQTGVTGAILFDLSDVITAPADVGAASTAVTEAVDAPTVTESPEVVEAAKADEQPMLAQIPYDVDDDSLKFGVASPEPPAETDQVATEIANTFDEDKVLQPSAIGAVAADAQVAAVNGSDATQQADTAQAQSEGLTAEDLAQIEDWQKSVVVRIAAARAYPAAARSKKIEGQVRVRFTIDHYGAVVVRDIETSSGWPVLDNAALSVLDGLDKLPTPPQHLGRDRITMIVPINYRFK